MCAYRKYFDETKYISFLIKDKLGKRLVMLSKNNLIVIW